MAKIAHDALGHKDLTVEDLCICVRQFLSAVITNKKDGKEKKKNFYPLESYIFKKRAKKRENGEIIRI